MDARLLGWKKNEKVYTAGDAFHTIGEFVDYWQDDSESRYAYYGSILMHVGFLAGMRLFALDKIVRCGILYRAIHKEV